VRRCVLATGTNISKHKENEKANKLYKKAKEALSQGLPGLLAAFTYKKCIHSTKKQKKDWTRKAKNV